MPQHNRKRRNAQIARHGIGMTNASGNNTNLNLAQGGGSQLNRVQRERLAHGGGNGGLNLHGHTPFSYYPIRPGAERGFLVPC
ncbi:hypothetical protein VRRI112168_18765 [Vreelandella rituensis]